MGWGMRGSQARYMYIHHLIPFLILSYPRNLALSPTSVIMYSVLASQHNFFNFVPAEHSKGAEDVHAPRENPEQLLPGF